ncbi:SDR family NAD(P)-dependent oxidoreductase [Ornithinimicrobium avium]|uniref:SDR family NAD(P)-dependent oxidoreductase n=1 Tax=Ornithinimicrobium avium TaxID=2283195 RepID=A0A345NKG6_9MICO|nr:SDR family oxidoreductase [Ornithinimicrobium avium]AXH95524.1 SDR family NAD(P)-dependent oxidoreductase [Ornithinimicrobium avium]
MATTNSRQRDLSGAHVAVVGATGALGSRLVAQLRESGAAVLVVGRDEERLAPLTGAAGAVVGDLADKTLGDRVVAAVERHLEGRLDGLVNAAGVVAFGPLADLDDDVAEELVLTNLVGPMWLLRRVVPMLRTSQGFVAQITGVVAEQAFPGMAAYGASKAGLAAAGGSLARELRRDRVDVVDLRPPHTETGLAGRALAGHPPAMPTGLDPDLVVRRMVRAIVARESVVGPEAFAPES